MCFHWVFPISLQNNGPKNLFFQSSTEQHLSYQDLRGLISTILVVLGYISFGQKWRRDCGGGVYFGDQLRAILKILQQIPIGKYRQKLGDFWILILTQLLGTLSFFKNSKSNHHILGITDIVVKYERNLKDFIILNLM